MLIIAYYTIYFIGQHLPVVVVVEVEAVLVVNLNLLVGNFAIGSTIKAHLFKRKFSFLLVLICFPFAFG